MDDDALNNTQESSKSNDGNQDFLILEQQRRIEQEVREEYIGWLFCPTYLNVVIVLLIRRLLPLSNCKRVFIFR